MVVLSGGEMRRKVLLFVGLALAACGGPEGPRHLSDSAISPLALSANSLNLRRVMGQDVLEKPLLPQPGDIWADVLPPPVVPDAHPAPDTHSAPPVAATPGRPVAAAAVLQAPVAAKADPPAVVAPPGKQQPMVQLAAAPSQQGAEAAWQRLQQQAPKLTDGRVPALSEAEVNGAHVWRLRASGFADVAEASAFCSSVREMKGECWVVTASP
jgi:hypothetical protein